MCSDRKALEIGEVFGRNCVDTVGVKKGGSQIVLKSMCPVTNGFVKLGIALLVSEIISG